MQWPGRRNGIRSSAATYEVLESLGRRICRPRILGTRRSKAGRGSAPACGWSFGLLQTAINKRVEGERAALKLAPTPPIVVWDPRQSVKRHRGWNGWRLTPRHRTEWRRSAMAKYPRSVWRDEAFANQRILPLPEFFLVVSAATARSYRQGTAPRSQRLLQEGCSGTFIRDELGWCF